MNSTAIEWCDLTGTKQEMRKSFQYRAKSNKQTEANANRWLELCRTLYNLALEQRITAYKQSGKSLSANAQKKELSDLKQAFPEFKTVGSQVLQDVIERLDLAFKSFFRRLKEKKGKAGFPRFKSANRYDSFTLKQSGWTLEGRYLHITGVGTFKLFLSRPIEGTIKTVTIRRSSTGKWFVSFSCDAIPAKELPEATQEVGIDIGLKSFLVDSEGNSVEAPKFFHKSEKVLRRRQRRLARRKKGSNRRGKARLLVAKAHEKITNQRKDFAHKLANQYVMKFQTIYVEDLRIQNMLKNRHLSKSIADASWGTFLSFLTYKAEEAGRQVVRVKPNGTSQICSDCGERVPKPLSVRVHACPFCGVVLDRDHNAALNILAAGQAVQALSPAVAGLA